MLMRTALLLLVFANLAFFAYAQFAGESATRAKIAQLEVSPDKIRVLKASGRSAPGRSQDATARSAPPSAATAVPATCLEWGVFAGTVVARADAALARLELSSAFSMDGADFSMPLRKMPYGTEFYVRDPDGYVLGFIQPAHQVLPRMRAMTSVVER
jgi:hypothetical protein